MAGSQTTIQKSPKKKIKLDNKLCSVAGEDQCPSLMYPSSNGTEVSVVEDLSIERIDDIGAVADECELPEQRKMIVGEIVLYCNYHSCNASGLAYVGNALNAMP